MFPAEDAALPVRRLMSVVFPLPDLPMMATNSPSAISRLTSRNATTGPPALAYRLVTPVMEISDCEDTVETPVIVTPCKEADCNDATAELPLRGTVKQRADSGDIPGTTGARRG